LEWYELGWAFYSLANLYRHQGKLKKAEAMYLRALQGNEAPLGHMHKWTLDSLHCLAMLLQDQGKLGEAEATYLRALQVITKSMVRRKMWLVASGINERSELVFTSHSLVAMVYGL
jgi:tetratricopeptide (TPR) repeat protein